MVSQVLTLYTTPVITFYFGSLSVVGATAVARPVICACAVMNLTQPESDAETKVVSSPLPI